MKKNQKIIVSALAIAAVVGITMVDTSPAPTEQELYSMGSFGRLKDEPVMQSKWIVDDYVTTMLTDKYGEYYNTGKKW